MERHTSVEVAARQTETMDGMIVAKLKQLIVERRTDLWWYLPTYLPTYPVQYYYTIISAFAT